ncbi:MAG: L-seryl-tRNA(Sec) selenium transferase [Armatimonadota bacterium]
MDQKQYRSLPSVSRLIESPELAAFPHADAVEAAREAIENARIAMGDGEPPPEEQILERAVAIATRLRTPGFNRAINCSGAILNTGLGRARLCREAVIAIQRVAESHSTLEVDLDAGTRGDRQRPLRRLLTRLTGAEDALVVNNNAAAVLLVVNTFALGKKALLSRGQSVEIGGSFRMPDVVRQAGATLVDVGCTNRTRVSDYDRAADEETSLIVRCHPSNFALTGFVEEPSVAELAECASRLGVVLLDDVGSGCLVETGALGLPHEPTLQESLRGGAHIITASGDKLLGGPQAGIILGRRDLVRQVARNPMARALRIDKLTAAALEATLRLYVEGREREIPTVRYLARSVEEVEHLAHDLAARLKSAGITTITERATAEPGGGALPGTTLPSARVGLPDREPVNLAQRLRLGEPPVIGYIQNDTLWLDMRTVDEEELDMLATAVSSACATP